jgi:hypothetical protein
MIFVLQKFAAAACLTRTSGVGRNGILGAAGKENRSD